jgi:hypothetical protein
VSGRVGFSFDSEVTLGEDRPAMRRALCISWLVTMSVLLYWPASAHSATDYELASRYRPILMFDSAERWRPLEINAFFNESLYVKARHRICAKGKECTTADEPADLFGGNVLDIGGDERGGSDYRAVRLNSCSTPTAPEDTAPKPRLNKRVQDCDYGPRSAIYYFVESSTEKITIDYWWFFRYNIYRDDHLICRVPIASICSRHEGDWEGIRVIVPVERPYDFTVLFDAHGRSERYSRIAPKLSGNRPYVYVAEGTHASYPRLCEKRRCTQTGRDLPDGRFNGKEAWGRNDASECGSTCLLPLADQAWATWPGVWGRKCSKRRCKRKAGPRSPRLQNRSRVVSSPRKRFS